MFQTEDGDKRTEFLYQHRTVHIASHAKA